MSAILKRDRPTQRLPMLHSTPAGPSDLTGKTLVVTASTTDETNVQALTAVIRAPQSDPANRGRFDFDVTSTQLTAIGAGAKQVLICVTLWNADASRFASARGVFNVVL